MSKPVPQTPQDKAAYDNHPILSKIPRIFRPYTTQFINAPVTHVTSFLVLHELTAILPLIGIWYILHQHHDLFMAASMDLPGWAVEKGTKAIDHAMEKWDFGNYSMNDKVKFIMEGAYAYVIVKALFPLRLAFSLLGMPFFARWVVIPFLNLFKRARKTPQQTPNPPEPLKVEPPKKHDPKKLGNPRL